VSLRGRTVRAGLLATLGTLVAACTLVPPSESPPAEPTPIRASADASPSETPSPTATPSPTPDPEVEVPLAVVTGYTAATASITLEEVRAAADTIRVPCGVRSYLDRAVVDGGDCLDAAEIADLLNAAPQDQPLLALLPPSMVTPDVKVLPVDGADLFGGPEARAADYPVTGTAIGAEPYDPDEIRTLMSLGDSCPDRGVAYAAITLGRGWDWVFGGGTAEYTAVYPNPVPAGYVGNGFNIVDAVRTDNEGAVAALVSGADVTLDDFECPVVDNWRVNDGVVFSIDPAVLPRLRDTYGVDVATLAANHLFDQGVDGFLETLDKFEAAGIPTAGAGTNLDDALEPALVDVNGLTFGFVGFNEIPPAYAEATPDSPGVLWLRDENVIEAAARARTEGADVVVCVPQWWGGAEYHAEFRGDMRRQQQVFFDAGCDQVVGHGTHWSGPIEITPDEDGAYHVTMVSHGNFLFGQEWSQQTQEGVTLELSFRGTDLVQARMHPYIMLDQAQTNLTDPATDGLYVLNRIYEASGLLP
jgi:poly-gamma-glutamate capsule biosynthesis protein CapA/YwtB (metallophosphatase superfamily)